MSFDKSLVALMIISSVTVAWASAPTPFQRSSKPRIEHPRISDDTLKSLADSHRAFALKLYHALPAHDKNIVFSPYSIEAALAMTMAGARGQTATQMADALALTLPSAETATAMNAFDQRLRRAVSRKQSSDADTLSIANAIWLQKGEQILPAYLDCLAENYGAGVGELNFAGAAAESAKIINEWVSAETKGKITDLLSADAVQKARLVLTNAIYFKGIWAEQFTKQATAPQAFHFLDGTSAEVAMMHNATRYQYAKQGDLEVVELPYRNSSLAMRFIVPAAGKFDAATKNLNTASLAAMSDGLIVKQVVLSVPKFKFTSTLSLNEILITLGMKDAFSGNADFSGINGKRDLLISDVIHKAFILVDEEGTEAAAATGVTMARASIVRDEPVVLTIDRPFFFQIIDHDTGESLFFGSIADPRN